MPREMPIIPNLFLREVGQERFSEHYTGGGADFRFATLEERQKASEFIEWVKTCSDEEFTGHKLLRNPGMQAVLLCEMSCTFGVESLVDGLRERFKFVFRKDFDESAALQIVNVLDQLHAVMPGQNGCWWHGMCQILSSGTRNLVDGWEPLICKECGEEKIGGHEGACDHCGSKDFM